MDKDDFYVEGYIIDDNGQRVSPNLKSFPVKIKYRTTDEP